MNRRNWSDGIFVNVVETTDRCTRALERAARANDPELEAAACSILSALVLVLGRRRAYIPEELREHYNTLLEKM